MKSLMIITRIERLWFHIFCDYNNYGIDPVAALEIPAVLLVCRCIMCFINISIDQSVSIYLD